MKSLGTIAQTSQGMASSSSEPGDLLKKLRQKMKSNKKQRGIRRHMRQEEREDAKEFKKKMKLEKSPLEPKEKKMESEGKSKGPGEYANPVRYKIKKAFRNFGEKVEDVVEKVKQSRLTRQGVNEVKQGKSKKNALTECPGGMCVKPGKN